MGRNCGFLLFFVLVLSGLQGRAQLTVTQGAALAMTPYQLVATWLIGNGINISNVTFNGSSANITSNQVGTFTTAGTAFTELQLNAGIVLTSGTAANTIGPNNMCGKSTNAGTAGDPDLNIIANATTHDAAVLEFDFIPQSDTIKFRYVFGSEELWTYCYSYNDAFGFFLSGPGITGTFSNNAENIALMPGSGNWVTINNLCDNQSALWCNAPVTCPKGGTPPPSYINCQEPVGGGQNLQYNGLTYVYTAWHVVIPCSTYHIKLAVADAADYALDSGVFLEKNSFSAVGLTVNTSFTVPSLGNKAVEGCSNAIVSFVLPQVTPTPYTINFTIGGTATNGIDYMTIPTFVVIPAGSDSTALIIIPFFDGIPEGVETVILDIAQPGCSGSQSIIKTIYIADNTPFFASAGPDDTICAQDSATLTATAWGGWRPYLYKWEGFTGNDSIEKVSPPPGAYQYVARVTDGCGVLARDTMQLLVKPLPVVSTGPVTNPICSGQTTSIPLQSSIPGSTFSWLTFNPSGQCSGFSPGSGSTISQTLVNTAYMTDSVRYTITATANGCPGLPLILWIKVKPTPDILFNPTSFTLCSGQSTAISLSSNVGSTSFSWTATASNPNLSGYSGGSGPGIIQTLWTTAPAPDTVFYHVTATSNGCASPVSHYPVVVNPVPQLTMQPMHDTICSGNVTNIQLTASCFGTFFIWTANQGIGNITGFSSGSGPLISQLLTDQLPSTGSTDYHITPATTSCTGMDSTYTMWVKPTPIVTNNPPGDSVCNGTALNVTLTASVPGTTFTWNCTPSSAQITGWANQTMPALSVNHTLVNSGNVPGWITYHITPTAVGCSGPLFDYTVVVYPTPYLINSPAGHSQCNNLSAAVSLQSNVSGTTFTWRAFASSINISGYHSNSGPGQTFIPDTLVNSGFTAGWVKYRLVPAAYGCPGDSTDYIVTVYPTPDLSNPSTSQSQCNNQNTNITLISNVSGTEFTWTAAGSSVQVTGYSGSSIPGSGISQVLTNTGYNVETVTYHIVPHANGCDGDTTNYLVTVFPVPDIYFVPNGQTICSRQSTGLSLQSHVAGASFTWTITGLSGGITGSGPGAGNMIQQLLVNPGYLPGGVTYQAVPVANGCTGTANSATVTVDPVPEVSLAACFDTITTTNAQSLWLKGGIPQAGSFTGQGVSNDRFYPSVAGIGNHPVWYHYTNTFGCRDSASKVIHVLSPAFFTCGEVLTDIRDNAVYPTVVLGSQCWMAANLNLGVAIGSSLAQRDNCQDEKYCYDDNPANCVLYGGLYNWDEVLRYASASGSQGLCPPGWHIPTESDWNLLFTFYISNGFAGSPLKSSGYSGFNALLSGIRFHNTIWNFPVTDPELRSVLYWSSSIHGTTKAWAHGLNEVVADIEYTPSVSIYPALRSNAFAVRCLRD